MAQAKKGSFLTYTTVGSMIIAMTLSIMTYVRDGRDTQARLELEQARIEVSKSKKGYIDHSKALEDISADLREAQKQLNRITNSHYTHKHTIPNHRHNNNTARRAPASPPIQPRTIKIRPKIKLRSWKELIQKKR